MMINQRIFKLSILIVVSSTSLIHSVSATGGLRGTRIASEEDSERPTIYIPGTTRDRKLGPSIMSDDNNANINGRVPVRIRDANINGKVPVPTGDRKLGPSIMSDDNDANIHGSGYNNNYGKVPVPTGDRKLGPSIMSGSGYNNNYGMVPVPDRTEPVANGKVPVPTGDRMLGPSIMSSNKDASVTPAFGIGEEKPFETEPVANGKVPVPTRDRKLGPSMMNNRPIKVKATDQPGVKKNAEVGKSRWDIYAFETEPVANGKVPVPTRDRKLGPSIMTNTEGTMDTERNLFRAVIMEDHGTKSNPGVVEETAELGSAWFGWF